MVDRAVYENLLLTRNLVIDYIHDFTPIMYFTFEWSWHSLLAYLNRVVGLSADQIFFLITTFILWRFSFDVLTKIGWQYLPLLINPLVVNFAFSQLRTALAIALISFVWRGQRGIGLTVVIYILATTIHTAMIIFLICHIASHLFKNNNYFNFLALASIGAAIAIAIGPLREMILSTINDRRTDYLDMASSAAYLSFWILLLLFHGVIFKFRNRIMSLDARYSITILSIVAINILTGGYSTRFIAASFPSLLISMKDLGGNRSRMIFSIFIPYTIILWMYWFRILG
ncbi:hypothetical protein EGO55_10680 [Caenibius tardaugens NBRC 16725]|nr:hypothetical protein [Caenibius tardaugens]AZI36359.1 hypothetical protein EGO55_10680 [Caenibius tardaugens NBRC 16725]